MFSCFGNPSCSSTCQQFDCYENVQSYPVNKFLHTAHLYPLEFDILLISGLVRLRTMMSQVRMKKMKTKETMKRRNRILKWLCLNMLVQWTVCGWVPNIQSLNDLLHVIAVVQGCDVRREVFCCVVVGNRKSSHLGSWKTNTSSKRPYCKF